MSQQGEEISIHNSSYLHPLRVVEKITKNIPFSIIIIFNAFLLNKVLHAAPSCLINTQVCVLGLLKDSIRASSMSITRTLVENAVERQRKMAKMIEVDKHFNVN
jgi:hypothetical protein